MATLEKIRSKAGLLIGVVGLALFAFVIGDFLNSGSTYFRQSQEKIAEVDGETVKIHDYQELVDEMTEMYKTQTGTSSLPEETMTQIRQMVFDGLVQDIVLGEATEKIGMTITPEEIFDMVQGENISPLMSQMQMFLDPQTGQLDKTALLNFLKAIEDDNINNYPEDQKAQLIQARNFWLFMEKNMKRQRMEQKYTTLLSKAVSANKLDAKNAYDGSSINSDINYVMQSYSSVPDSLINVSNAEIEKLYNQRKESFKQKESKVISYVAVDIRPSKEDYDKVSADVEAVKEELSSNDNVAEIVNENSEVPFVDAFFAGSELDNDMKTFAESAAIGDVYGPVFENDKYRMFKLVDKKSAPEQVKVSHIMIAGQDAAANEKKVEELMAQLKDGADFATVAKENSVDQAAANGGELGWFNEVSALRNVGEEFANTIFNTPVNGLSVVKSNYGTHIVKVTEKKDNVNKYKIADVEISVTPSSKTYSSIYNDLNQFVSKNNTKDKMSAAAQEAGYNFVQDVTVTSNDPMVGVIKNSRPVVRWAFQSSKGDVSDILECNDVFVVAVNQGTLPEGYRSLASVTPMLKSELIAEKKGEKIAADLATKNLTSLEAYAEAMGASENEVKYITFDTPRITGIGTEPKLNAAVSLASEGQLSAPVAGENGVYVFQVVSRTQNETPYNEAEQIKSLDNSNLYRLSYQAIQYLINKADIKDNRVRFY
jgi:peptidyl-prolyl cis-trans isomerase D